jgi:hypothetical protein
MLSETEGMSSFLVAALATPIPPQKIIVGCSRWGPANVVGGLIGFYVVIDKKL